jgi:uncharacterized membrane protein affecting hemolysin expression
MSKMNFEYAKNRFVNPKKIVDASIYTKQAQAPDAQGNYHVTVRVALSIDTENKDKGTVYSDPFATETAAREFIQNIPEQ